MDELRPLPQLPSVDSEGIRKSVTPLRLVFWGALICIIDITFSQTVNGEGFKIDVLDDTVGAILIAVGVFRLGRIVVDNAYATWMTFVKSMAVVVVIETFFDHFIMRLPEGIGLIKNLLGLAELAAIVVFCWCMRRLCQVSGLSQAAGSWKVTIILFAVVFVAPLALLYLLYLAGLVAIVSGKSFNVNLGPGGLLLIPVFIVPVVHLFMSTSRMKRAAEAQPSRDVFEPVP